jgi:hypothetical protein
MISSCRALRAVHGSDPANRRSIASSKSAQFLLGATLSIGAILAPGKARPPFAGEQRAKAERISAWRSSGGSSDHVSRAERRARRRTAGDMRSTLKKGGKDLTGCVA